MPSFKKGTKPRHLNLSSFVCFNISMQNVLRQIQQFVPLYCRNIWFWKLALCDVTKRWQDQMSLEPITFFVDFSQGTQGYYTYTILCSISFIIRFFYRIPTLIHIVISEGLNTLPILWWQQTIHMHCICYSSQSWSVPEYGSAHKLHWQAESQFFFTDALYALFFSKE